MWAMFVRGDWRMGGLALLITQVAVAVFVVRLTWGLGVVWRP
jgi:hypothetical protein